MTANRFQFVLKSGAPIRLVETVGNTADGRVAFSELTLIGRNTLILLKKLRELTKISSMMV